MLGSLNTIVISLLLSVGVPTMYRSYPPCAQNRVCFVRRGTGYSEVVTIQRATWYSHTFIIPGDVLPSAEEEKR
ncbi:hypothetical protein HVTV-2_gp83 [Haloarcula virus HVTV-2]|nr:hypothetical protein HVTV-2_gp83 [Haloarcula virus HVTV-2]